MPESDRMPRELVEVLSGRGFRARKRLALPFLTIDPEGFPRAALLTLSEVRVTSATSFCVAVQSKSLTAANLIRRQKAALYYLAADRVVWIQASAGHGWICGADPDRQIFPLSVFRVKVDRASPREGSVRLLAGPTFSAARGLELFSEELFEELGRKDA